MRLAKLDILRTFAVLLVLGRHLCILSPEGGVYHANFLFRFWNRFGWTGVDLFFVLSGFLVSGLLFSEYKKYGSINLLRFFIRRGFKIYPAFYFFIGLSILLKIIPENMSLPRILSEAVFVQNYFPGIWNHTWSLAVEEHFYALVGVLLFFLSLKKTSDPFRNIHIFFLICAVSVLLMRLYVSMSQPYSHMKNVFPSHLRIDALFFGVVLSYCNHFKNKELELWTTRNLYLILGASALCILPCFLWELETFFVHTFGLTFLYLGFGGLLLVILYEPHMEQWIGRGFIGVIARLGAYSYSIYLWHMPVRYWQNYIIKNLIGYTPSPAIQTLAYVFLCMIVGVLMAKIVEMPFLKLRDHFFPSRSKMGIN